MSRQECSNQCVERHYNRAPDLDSTGRRIWGTCDDCGGNAPDLKPCACECHQERPDRASDRFIYNEGNNDVAAYIAEDAAKTRTTCDKCGNLLSEVEAAGRKTGTCNECLRDPNTDPRVGDGATIQYYSDRVAATVVEVSPSGRRITLQVDHATRTDSNGMSESQSYHYTPNPVGFKHIAYRRNDGRYQLRGGYARVFVGHRSTYRDFSF